MILAGKKPHEYARYEARIIAGESFLGQAFSVMFERNKLEADVATLVYELLTGRKGRRHSAARRRSQAPAYSDPTARRDLTTSCFLVVGFRRLSAIAINGVPPTAHRHLRLCAL